MTKKEALSYANNSVTQLAKILGISHNAVSQWKDEKIPRLREYELKEKFGEPKNKTP